MELLAFSSMAKVFIAAEIVVESRLLPINAFRTKLKVIKDCIGLRFYWKPYMDPYAFYMFLPLSIWGFSVRFPMNQSNDTSESEALHVSAATNGLRSIFPTTNLCTVNISKHDRLTLQLVEHKLVPLCSFEFVLRIVIVCIGLYVN